MRREAEEGRESLAHELVRRDPTTKVDLKNPVRVRRALEKLTGSQEKISVTIPKFRKLKIRTNPDPDELKVSIAKRAKMMFERGWEQEVRNLLSQGVPETSPGFRVIGYQSVARYVCGEIDRSVAEADIVLRTLQYAKRQRTWMRSELNLVALPQTQCNDGDKAAALSSAMQLVKSLGDTEKQNG